MIKDNRGSAGDALFLLLIIGIPLLIIGGAWYGITSYNNGYMLTDHWETINVSEKWIKEAPNYDNSNTYGQQYLISDTNGNVYTTKDDQLYGFYTASNVYAMLLPNHQYKIRLVGYRNARNSEYQNIIDVKEVINAKGNSS